MGQARTRSDPEITLFPFLSILLCIIGALVLIIVILTLVQTVLGDGRGIEEVARAREAERLRREMAARSEELKAWEAETEKGESLRRELGTKKERFVVLHKKIEGAAEEGRRVAFEHAAQQKELENLLLQIEQMQAEAPALRAEIEKLKAEVAARKLSLEAKPKIVVQGSGSGIAAGEMRIFFVECNSAGIAMHTPAGPQRISSGSIGTDAGYDDFLRHVALTPKSQVVFLLRNDGLTSYNRAAGWAESRFNVRHGKLPVPGQGEVDLSLFQRKPPN